MGQSLDLVFLGPEENKQETFRAKLSGLGIRTLQPSPIIDLVEWTRPSHETIPLEAHTHRGGDVYWTELSLDSISLRSLNSLEKRRLLIDDFLELGTKLWASSSFYEGMLAPEEGGLLVSTSKQKFHKMRLEMVQDDIGGLGYANFLSHQAADLIRANDWVLQTQPKASTRPLSGNGLLVIWDASNEGLRKFLSSDLSIV